MTCHRRKPPPSQRTWAKPKPRRAPADTTISVRDRAVRRCPWARPWRRRARPSLRCCFGSSGVRSDGCRPFPARRLHPNRSRRRRVGRPGPRRLAEDHHWRGRLLRSRSWPAWRTAPAGVVWADWRRLVRRPRRIGVLQVSTVLPALAAAAGMGRYRSRRWPPGAADGAAASGRSLDAGDPPPIRCRPARSCGLLPDVALFGCAPALLALDAPLSAAAVFLIAQALAKTFALIALPRHRPPLTRPKRPGVRTSGEQASRPPIR
ncbi:hypothetical protein SAMN04489713_111118 [Actinomadura madurae]|uniref:Uncharacterized protein n=1 Tax=Actinomadura madurae TaxID=1993 RepID=A0A1I5M1I6_9ACTN|nr:hypothetical protein SAMN04489713_111118 [Actinomadura madurae]